MVLLTSASLIIDYVLTVAVSVSMASIAVSSAFPILEDYLIEMALGLLVLLMMINLRGVRSTARIFAWPTYMFIASIILLIAVGLYKYHMGNLEPFIYSKEHLKYMHNSMGVLTLTLVLRAFSSGSAALTGIESYANGVSSFKAPMMSKALEN